MLGIPLLLAPVTNAPAARSMGVSPSSARGRALRIYRRRERPVGTPRARASVVGGAQASIEQVPWQVAVFAEFEAEGHKAGLLCGGSIIDMNHVLTAAHCAFNPVTQQPLAAGNFVVLAGASSITAEEIREGATVEARFVESRRIHPDFNYAAGPGTPDDLADLQLAFPLQASPAIKPVELPASATSPPEGTLVALSGFGQEHPLTEELDEKLYTIGMTLSYSRQCGGEVDALFLCASNSGGSACSGDSGGGLVHGSPPVLVGVIDTVQVLNGRRCLPGAVNGFVNLAAPETLDFVDGSENPPLAPRGGGVGIRAVPQVGQFATCEPGSWSGSPSFAYAFTDSANGQVLQSGSASTYPLTAADVGRTVACEVQATNAGGTGMARTTGLAPVEPATPAEPIHTPVSREGGPPTGGGAPQPPPSAPPLSLPVLSEASVPPVEEQEATDVSLVGSGLTVGGNGAMVVKLRCKGSERCSGKLTLAVRSAAKRTVRKSSDAERTIGVARFSIAAEKSSTVKLTLDSAGRALIAADRGRLSARLTIQQLGPEETPAQTKPVSLKLHKSHR